MVCLLGLRMVLPSEYCNRFGHELGFDQLARALLSRRSSFRFLARPLNSPKHKWQACFVCLNRSMSV